MTNLPKTERAMRILETGEDFGRRYEIKTETKTIKAVLVDGELYSTSFDFGEPISPLPKELQAK